MEIKNSIEKVYMRHPQLWFWSLVVLFILPVSFIQVYDNDIWWHMQCGKSILSNFAWPDFTEYYFSPVTQSTGNLRYTFLGDIIFHLVYMLSGDFGLQMMRMAAVLLACFLLRSMAGKKYRGWHVLLLMILVVGTYQKQLVRNSLYAHYLVPVIFYMWYLICQKQKKWYIWLYPLVLGIWGCLHGSYLLGFCLSALIFSGDIIDKFKTKSPDITRCIGVYGIVLALSLGVISVWNPTTSSYLRLSNWINFQKVNSKINNHDVPKNLGPPTDAVSESEKERLIKFPELSIKPTDFVPEKQYGKGFLYSLKHWLNNTVFKSNSSPVQSADFLSPFDKLDRLYVWIALFSGFLGIIIILFFLRPVRYSLVLPFAGVLFVGLGYLRLCGYIPLAAAAVVFFAAGENTLKRIEIKRKKYLLNVPWILSFILLLLLWCNCLLGFPVKIGTGLHAFGLGRVPVFSEKCSNRVYSEFKKNKVFTTMATGGYLLYKWFPGKKVFVDGFFSPHPPKVLLHLRLLREQGVNPDFLFAEYGIDVALVDHSSGSILNCFFNSENWYIQYIDTGMVCFAYQPDFYSDIKIPEVLMDSREVDALPVRFRLLAANSLHTIVNALYKKGRLKDGAVFVRQNQALLERTKPFINSKFLSVTEQLRLSGQEIYGLKNIKTQFYEYKHNEAIEIKDDADIIKYGLKVLEKYPDRLAIIMNIAIVYLKTGKIDACLEMLVMLENRSDKNRLYFEQNRRNISKFYWELSKRARKSNEYIKAYSLAQKAHKIDPGLISQGRLYQTSMGDVSKLNNQGDGKLALSLLELLEPKFGESARWLNDMAWQIVFTSSNSQTELKRAAKYSKRAIHIMELKQYNILDLAYDTMAVIAFKQGKIKDACMYIHKALAIAPDNRKSEYGNRPECK